MERPTLLAYLAQEQIAPIARRSWFAGEYVPLGHYLWRAQSLFETGTGLGAGFRDNMLSLIALFCQPGEESKELDALRQFTSERSVAVSNPPETLSDLFLMPEAERLMAHLRETGRTEARTVAELPRVARVKLPLPKSLIDAQEAVRQGLGWGSQHPDLVERLCSRAVDPQIWEMARGFEPTLPPQPPEPKPFRLRQKEARSTLQQYVTAVRPDLLAHLGLWPEGPDTFELRWRALRARMTGGQE